MDELVKTIKEITDMSMENDRALLKVIEALVDRVVDLEHRIYILEVEKNV